MIAFEPATTVELVTTVDRSSGHVHERALVTKSGTGPDGQAATHARLLDDERCNLDQSGSYDVFGRGTPSDRGDGVPSDADPASVCKFCFPVLFSGG